jgi:hypothetical protein
VRIEADSIVPFARSRTYAAYRDEMAHFVRYLPNIQGIDVEERAESDDVVRVRNVWHGGGEMPAALRAVVKSDMFSWTDYATWVSSDWLCEWRIETHSLSEAVRCDGTTRFVELPGERTRLEIRGELSIDLSRLRAVPTFIAGSLGRKVEQFLVRQITPNLTGVSDALTTYLETQR